MSDDMSHEIGALAEALSRAQSAFAAVERDRSVTVQHKDGSSHSYDYATLASVWDAARKPLADNGLAVVQTTRDGGNRITVITTLLHSSGQWIRGELSLQPADQMPQSAGSAITYARRYGLAAMLGLASADEDDDGAAGQPQAEGAARTYTLKPAAGSGVGFRFGALKGKPLSAGSDRDLAWYASALEASIADPAKAQYREANARDLAAVQAEQAARTLAAPASAPTADEKDDDPEPPIGPEQATITRAEATAAHAELAKLAASIGVSKEDLALVEKSCLSKRGLGGMGALKRGELARFTWEARQAIRNLVPVD